VQLKEIILNNTIEKQDFVFSDSAYYAQPQRKLAIIKDNYKYIYNKENNTEELYDTVWDPFENRNLMLREEFDIDRKKSYDAKIRYFYPYYTEADKAYDLLAKKKSEIWRTGSFFEEAKGSIKYKSKKLLFRAQKYLSSNK